MDKITAASIIVGGLISKHPWHRKNVQQTNKNKAFGFLDLPTELRLSIYEFLLTLQEMGPYGRASCWPQILATCRRINDEGSEILDTKNMLDINLLTHINMTTRRNVPKIHFQQTTRVTSLENRMDCIDLRHVQRYLRRQYCPFLRKAYHISLNIRTSYENDYGLRYETLRDIDKPIIAMIDWISDTMAWSNRAQSFQINVYIDKPHLTGNDRLLKTILWPLAKICKPEIFTFNGLSIEVLQHLNEVFDQYNRRRVRPLHYAIVSLGLSALGLSDEEEEMRDYGAIVKGVGRKLEHVEPIYRMIA